MYILYKTRYNRQFVDYSARKRFTTKSSIIYQIRPNFAYRKIIIGHIITFNIWYLGTYTHAHYRIHSGFKMFTRCVELISRAYLVSVSLHCSALFRARVLFTCVYIIERLINRRLIFELFGTYYYYL